MSVNHVWLAGAPQTSARSKNLEGLLTVKCLGPGPAEVQIQEVGERLRIPISH